MLHHCKSCWYKYHNGERDQDFVPPAYYGEPLFNLDEWISERDIKWKARVLENMPIKPDRDRPYMEGDYNH